MDFWCSHERVPLYFFCEEHYLSIGFSHRVVFFQLAQDYNQMKTTAVVTS